MKLKQCFKDCPGIMFVNKKYLDTSYQRQFCRYIAMATDNARLCSMGSIKEVNKYLKELK